jgi:hypothetical protein
MRHSQPQHASWYQFHGSLAPYLVEKTVEYPFAAICCAAVQFDIGSGATMIEKYF